MSKVLEGDVVLAGDADVAEVLATHIEISSIPSGFPPDWVRKCWVGCIIPLNSPLRPQSMDSQWNPSTGEIIPDEITSYEVRTLEAMAELRKNSEAAYQWFVDNEIAEDYPVISFQAQFCEKVVKAD